MQVKETYDALSSFGCEQESRCAVTTLMDRIYICVIQRQTSVLPCARAKQAAKNLLHKARPAMAAAVAKTKFAKAKFLAAARQRQQRGLLELTGAGCHLARGNAPLRGGHKNSQRRLTKRLS